MILTAHGGAMGTGRNSKKYFDVIYRYDIDVIEVDVRKRGDLLYIAHLKSFFPNRHIPLRFVFEYVIKHKLKVNCDLKNRGIIGDVINLAKECKALKHLIFTGSVKPSDLKDITAGDVYVNSTFYKPLNPSVENLERIKEFLISCNNPCIKGINIHHRHASDAFIDKAKELDLALSIYTVDNPIELKRIMMKKVANVTTNNIISALEIIKETGK